MRYPCSGTAVSCRRIGGIRSSGTAVLPHKNIQLLRICSGEAIEGTIPATQEYRDFVKNLHSKQILNMQVIIPFYEVRFQYETIRKNLRTGKKYFFASNGEHEDIDLEIGMKLENSVDYEKKLQENAIFRKYY